jgi:hypothetical protein
MCLAAFSCPAWSQQSPPVASRWLRCGPRRHPFLSARRLAEYAAAEPALTRRVLLDTAEEMAVQGSRVLDRKTARLKLSFVALSVAGLTLAVGIAL